MKLPENERAGELVSRHVALVDVFPTVLEVVGLKRPEPVDGVSLLGADAPSRAIYSETFFPRLHLGWSELFSIIGDEHHYIEAPRVEAPELVDAWTLLGDSQSALGQRARAVETLRAAAARFPERGDVRLKVAELYFQTRDYAAAETEARTALASSEIAANEIAGKDRLRQW